MNHRLYYEKDSSENNFEIFSPAKKTILNNLDYQNTNSKKSPKNLAALNYRSFSNGTKFFE